MKILTTMWIVGEADDHLAAVFTDEEKARAYLNAKIGGRPDHNHSWWIEEIDVNPEPPTPNT